MYVVNVPNKAYFESLHIILEVVSESSTGKYSALGQATISMKGTSGQHPKRFNEPLLSCGVEVGYIAGSLHFKSSSSV